VRPVRTRRDLRRFIALPFRLHARDPNWVPPLRPEVRKLLDRRRNPFFEHGEAEYFLAERHGEVVGRVAAIANQAHNAFHGDRTGFFGFFESERDGAVARALLDAAAGWCRTRGFDTLRGPASFSTNDECGVLVDGFDTPNTIMMPHNPPWYAELVEGAGFAGVMDLWAYQGGTVERYVEPPERFTRALERMRERLGVTVRTLRLEAFDREVELIKRLYNRCWERNWGFIPMTDREIDVLAEAFKPVVFPGLVPIVEKDGEPIGFGLALPDLNEALRTNRSGRAFPAVLRLLWWLRRHKFRRLRILLLGVLPEYRGKGVDALMYHHIWVTSGQRYGITWGEAGWILENNHAMNAALEKMTFRRYKTYRMYDRRL
jgi:GNAT superfamily N-acetyltransferase